MGTAKDSVNCVAPVMDLFDYKNVPDKFRVGVVELKFTLGIGSVICFLRPRGKDETFPDRDLPLCGM